MSNNATFSNRNRNGSRNYNGGNGWGRPRWQRDNPRSRRENIRSRRRASVRNGYNDYNSNRNNGNYRSNGYNANRSGSGNYRSATRNDYNNSRNNGNYRNGNRPETGQCSADNCNNRTPAHYLPLCNTCYFEKRNLNEAAELRKDQVSIPAGMTDQTPVPAAAPLPDIYPDETPYCYTASPVQATLIPEPETAMDNTLEDEAESAVVPMTEDATEIPQTDETVTAEPEDLIRQLEAYRSAYAQENGTQPRRAINDSVLREIATAMPDNSDALSQVKGVGTAFMSRHGDAVLAIIGQD